MSVVNSEKIPLGWSAPLFSLPDVDGKIVSLKDFSQIPVLVVIFTCNHCPYALAAWPILVKLDLKYKHQIQMVAINSNDQSEYPLDSVEGMKELSVKENVNFPYLRDADQTVAVSFQAQCTPDIYVFKNQGEGDFQLTYHGRVNDNWQHPELVTEQSLDLAIERAVNDLDPILDQHPSMGCSIKWRQ